MSPNSVPVDLHDPITILKQAIQDSEGVPVHQQQLQYAGTLLRDNDRTLSDYWVESGAELHMVLMESGGSDKKAKAKAEPAPTWHKSGRGEADGEPTPFGADSVMDLDDDDDASAFENPILAEAMARGSDARAEAAGALRLDETAGLEA